jgi:threonine dehydrogenase-like Zn-dependent dehydrogenase
VPELGQVLVRTICRGIRGSDPHAAKHTHADLANPERHGKVMVDS